MSKHQIVQVEVTYHWERCPTCRRKFTTEAAFKKHWSKKCGVYHVVAEKAKPLPPTMCSYVTMEKANPAPAPPINEEDGETGFAI